MQTIPAGSLKALLFPPYSTKYKTRGVLGDARGASEVRRGTFSTISIVRHAGRPVILSMDKNDRCILNYYPITIVHANIA